MAYELVGSGFLTNFPAIEEGAGPELLEREERRLTASVSLVVCGLNSSGRLFFELASIHDISRSGCRIHLGTKPQSDSPLAVRVFRYKGEAKQEIGQLLFQVVWTLPEPEGWAVWAESVGGTDLRTLVFPLQNT
jgi:hypothetical protein